jgi:hypothetical protein
MPIGNPEIAALRRQNGEKKMSVIRANIQTVDDLYRLVWTVISSKNPIEANYQRRRRLLCPHRLGRNRNGQVRVLCYQYGGESMSFNIPTRPKTGTAWCWKSSAESD